MLDKKLKKISERVYPLVKELQEMIINYKILRKNGRYYGGGTKVVEGMGQYFEDLSSHQVQQIFQYLHKVDTTRKVYSILSSIQDTSSRIYFYTFIKSDDINIGDDMYQDDDGPDSQDNISKIDKINFDMHKNQHNREQIEMMIECFPELKHMSLLPEQKKIVKNKNWQSELEIFTIIEKIILFGYIKNDRGILMKLHMINLYFQGQIEDFDKSIFYFRDLMDKRKRYKKRLNLVTGIRKVVKLIIHEYIKDSQLYDDNILIGDKQINIYSNLLILVMIKKGKIEEDDLTEKQLKEIKSIKNIFKFTLDDIFDSNGQLKFVYGY